MAIYAAFGDKPSDVELITKLTSKSVGNTSYYPPSSSIMQNGTNLVPFTITNIGTDNKTYYGYGYMSTIAKKPIYYPITTYPNPLL